MIHPIPLNVLIHEVTYQEYIPGTSWEPEGYKTAVTLKNVRVDMSSKITRNNNGEQILYNALLFYDMTNSLSTDVFEFVEKSKVTFSGKTMYVNKVNPAYGYTLHHYEVELI